MKLRSKSLVIQKPAAVSKSNWKKIHDLRKKIADSESKLSKLIADKKTYFEQVSVEIADIELEYCRCVKEIILILIRFIPYKSLSERRLEGLLMWINELKELIENNPFNYAEQRITLTDIHHLQDNAIKARLDKFEQNPTLTLNPNANFNLHANINNMLKLLLQSIEESLEEELPLFNKKQCIALIVNPDLRDKVLSDPFFQKDTNYIEERNELGEFKFTFDEILIIGEAIEKEAKNIYKKEMGLDDEDLFTDTDDEDEFYSDDFFSYFTQDRNEQECIDESVHANAEKLLDNEEINKLYRQLAHKFHPDKLTEKDDKALYLELMKELSSAKKTKNFHVIIELAMTHLPEMTVELSNETFEVMIKSLSRKLREIEQNLNYQKHYDESKESLVWDKFKARTKKQTLINVENHKISLHAEILKFKTHFFSKPVTLKKIIEGIDELLYLRG